MFVKICGITTEDDALLAVAMGADAVGFIFAPSERRVAVQRVHDITRRLPPEILTVGVFRDEHPRRVVDMVLASGVRAAQLHGHETPSEVADVARNVPVVIKAVSAGSRDAAHADEFGVKMILVDAPSPGSGHVFDWKLVDDVPAGLDVILAGGLTPDNVAAGIKMARPWGVDVSSGVESAPGVKDPVLVRRFIEAARSMEEQRPRSDRAPYDWMDE